MLRDAFTPTGFRLWKRLATYLGCAFAFAVGAVALFLKGAPLHEHWSRLGVPLLFIAMFLGWAFVYSAGTTYNIRESLRRMQKIEDEYPEVRDQE
jgi:hypothetical protein